MEALNGRPHATLTTDSGTYVEVQLVGSFVRVRGEQLTSYLRVYTYSIINLIASGSSSPTLSASGSVEIASSLITPSLPSLKRSCSQAAAKNFDLGQRIALCTLKVLLPQMIVRSVYLSSTKRLGGR